MSTSGETRGVKGTLFMQDILGHADAETTLQIYADATKELKKSELINFEDYFNALKDEQENDA